MLVKLGGSLITDKNTPFAEQRDVIDRLTMEIHEAKHEKDITLVVGHGSGSYGHLLARRYQTQRGVINIGVIVA